MLCMAELSDLEDTNLAHVQRFQTVDIALAQGIAYSILALSDHSLDIKCSFELSGGRLLSRYVC